MRKYMCYATICPEKRKCELCTYCHRYVRTDVAMRYARMRERKYKTAAILRGYWDDEMQKEAEVEEAQQAWIKQNRGNVAQREGII